MLVWNILVLNKYKDTTVRDEELPAHHTGNRCSRCSATCKITLACRCPIPCPSLPMCTLSAVLPGRKLLYPKGNIIVLEKIHKGEGMWPQTVWTMCMLGPNSLLLIFWAKFKSVCSLEIKVKNTLWEEIPLFFHWQFPNFRPTKWPTCERLSIPEDFWELKNQIKRGKQDSTTQVELWSQKINWKDQIPHWVRHLAKVLRSPGLAWSRYCYKILFWDPMVPGNPSPFL